VEAAALLEGHGRPDQCEVRERLREVAELPPGDRVVLLGEEADVVAEIEQPLEESRAWSLALRSAGDQKEQGKNTPSPGGSPSTAPPSSGR
jgi:hypothetical protein